MGYKRDPPTVLTRFTLKVPEFHGAGFSHLSLLSLAENALLLVRTAAGEGTAPISVSWVSCPDTSTEEHPLPDPLMLSSVTLCLHC